MQERAKPLVIIAILVSLVLLIVVVIGVVTTGKQTISPLPEEDEGAIKIIFLSPTPSVSEGSNSGMIVPSATNR